MTNISRREALKQFAFVSAGMVLVPSCMQDKTKSGFLLKKIKVSPSDETMLAELCESIIPKTKTPGAKDLSAHLFVLMMVDDCTSKEQQDAFIQGMEAFNALSKSKTGKTFIDCTDAERKKIIDNVLSINEKEAPVANFFNEVKKRTIQAYTSSEFFLTNVHLYELIPGRYHGCVAA
jgi:hypothetical protein